MTDKELEGEFSREIPYPSGGDVPHHRLSVDPEAFQDTANLIPTSPKRIDKKLNLRIRTEDHLLLKALADAAGVKNSTLLNKLLHDLLLEALLGIEEEDARALLAKKADDQAEYDGFERPWCAEVAGRHTDEAIQNALDWNDLTPGRIQGRELERYGMTRADIHSKEFNELMRLFEERS